MKLYSSSVTEDAVICIASTLCAAAFVCDGYLPEAVNGFVRPVTFVIMILCWTGMSLLNGLRLRKNFAAITIVWFMFPTVTELMFDHIRPFRFSDAGLLLREASMITGIYPYNITGSFTEEIYMLISVLMSVICLLLFAAGYIYTHKNIMNVNTNDTERN